MEYSSSLKFLSECLDRHHDEKVIILIDEYDVPLERAYFNGYYNEMINFLRSLFNTALKTNESLFFSVMTGCLRISIFNSNKFELNLESIFTGFNNPWSIICYLDDLYCGNIRFPKPYWSNTSSNNIIRELIANSDSETKEEVEMLISGKTITKPIHEDIIYSDIMKNMDNLWNFLFFTGYLKKTDELTNLLMDSISYLDDHEHFYHGFFLAFLSMVKGYIVKSNRESGKGRNDITVMPSSVRKRAIIIEVKNADTFAELGKKCDKALKQIEEKKYDHELKQLGYSDILKYGIAFYRKDCMVKK